MFVFHVDDGQGSAIFIAPTRITLKRDISVDNNTILAKQAKENLLYRDMQSDLVAAAAASSGGGQAGRACDLMQVRLDALPAQLAKRLAPLYVVHGDEHLLAIEAADRIRAAARKAGFTERDVLQVDRHFHWSRLVESGQSLSLFGDRKLIESCASRAASPARTGRPRCRRTRRR